MQTPTFTRRARVWDKTTASYVQVTIKVDVDIQALADHLAFRAVRSKHKKSVIQGGIIKGSIVD